MVLSVDTILGSINSTGVARTSHYQINIAGIDQNIALRATSVTLPGRSVQATTYRDYGASREIAYLPLYTQASVTLLCSSDLRERTAFTEWQDSIIGPHRTGATGYADPFEAGYYDDYVRSVDIMQMDTAGDMTYKCQLIEAYPRSISDITYSYAAEEIASFSVQFQFRYFTEN
jgi:hypothetical protein